MEVTTSLGDNNTYREQGGQYYTAIVAFLMLLFNADVLLFLLFAADIWKLLSLTQGIMKLFLKSTVLLGNKNIDKERGSKYYETMFVFFLLLFAAAVQERVLNFYSSHI